MLGMLCGDKLAWHPNSQKHALHSTMRFAPHLKTRETKIREAREYAGAQDQRLSNVGITKLALNANNLMFVHAAVP